MPNNDIACAVDIILTRKKELMIVPIMLPKVDNAKIPPLLSPTDLRDCTFNLIKKGVIIPISIAGIKKIMQAAIKALYPKLISMIDTISQMKYAYSRNKSKRNPDRNIRPASLFVSEFLST
jgi:hypothetical protein